MANQEHDFSEAVQGTDANRITDVSQLQVIGNDTSFISNGAPTNIAHAHQKTRYYRRLEMSCQLEEMRRHEKQAE